MPKPGDVVTVDFPGAQGINRRPVVIVSSDAYHATRPDVILAVLTTNIAASSAPTDYILQEWRAAGLNNPSVFRVFLATMSASSIMPIGHLSERDWLQIQICLRKAIAVNEK
jgi:mRNA interferase MazF